MTVIDQSGSLLTAQKTSNTTSEASTRASSSTCMRSERSFVKRIEDVLTPITGGPYLAGHRGHRFHADRKYIADLQPRPVGRTRRRPLRSQQTSESSGSSGGAEQGRRRSRRIEQSAARERERADQCGPCPRCCARPAARSRCPGPDRLPARRLPARGAIPTVNYEVDKTIKHTRQPVGAIKRLSVAVVVNHRKLVDADGKVSTKALSAEEMTQINALVKEVMGYSKERGDSVNVTNSAFSVAEVEPAAEVPLWKQPETIATAKNIGRNVLIAALVLFLVLGVLRPLLTKLAEVRLPPPAAADAPRPSPLPRCSARSATTAIWTRRSSSPAANRNWSRMWSRNG